MQLIRQMQQKCVPEYTSFVFKMAAEVTLNARPPLSWRNFSAMNPFTANSQKITRTNKLEITVG